MIGLFFWQASVAVDKYQSKLTSLQERLEDSGTLLYPSITFCTKYIWEGFPGVMEILNNNKSMDFYDIKNFAQMNYWTRRKVFSFVSHQNVIRNKSFPCNTVGGSKTGKPCSFPFIYQSIGTGAKKYQPKLKKNRLIVDQSWENSTGDVNMSQPESSQKETFLYFDMGSQLRICIERSLFWNNLS